MAVEPSLQIAMKLLRSMGLNAKFISKTKEVTAKVGKPLGVRLLGGALCPGNWLPVTVRAFHIERGGRYALCVRVEESFGFGSLLGIEGKYRARCEELKNQVSGIIQPQLS
jgi:hypothetical protein